MCPSPDFWVLAQYGLFLIGFVVVTILAVTPVVAGIGLLVYRLIR